MDMDWSVLLSGKLAVGVKCVQEAEVVSMSGADNSFLYPYKVLSSTPLIAFCDEEPAFRSYFNKFLEQAPNQDSTKTSHRAIGPIRESMTFFEIAPVDARVR